MKKKGLKMGNVEYRESIVEGILRRENKKQVIYGPKYCKICGLENEPIRDERGLFDNDTGKPLFFTYCPKNPCGHTRHRWIGSWNQTCLTCGKESGTAWACQ